MTTARQKDAFQCHYSFTFKYKISNLRVLESPQDRLADRFDSRCQRVGFLDPRTTYCTWDDISNALDKSSAWVAYALTSLSS